MFYTHSASPCDTSSSYPRTQGGGSPGPGSAGHAYSSESMWVPRSNTPCSHRPLTCLPILKYAMDGMEPAGNLVYFSTWQSGKEASEPMGFPVCAWTALLSHLHHWHLVEVLLLLLRLHCPDSTLHQSCPRPPSQPWGGMWGVSVLGLCGES